MEKESVDKHESYVMMCDCGCSALEISTHQWAEGDITREINHYAWNINGADWKDIFKERFEVIWSIIRGKDYCLWGIIIRDDKLEEFKSFVADM